MGFVEGWMGIVLVGLVVLNVQVGSQDAFVGLEIVSFEQSRFDLVG
jgi:hypothetical protein